MPEMGAPWRICYDRIRKVQGRFGFYIGEADVHVLHKRMQRADLEVGDISAIHRGTMFYVTAPGGILIEICCPKAPET